MYSDYEIHEVAMGYGPTRRKVETFLHEHGIDLDRTDYYAAICPTGDDAIVAAGGLLKDTIRCIAVDDSVREEHLANRLVSHLMAIVQRRGYPTVKVFTKPEYEELFESLAFNTIAKTDNVVFMENSLHPFHQYLNSLKNLSRPGKSGVIVMNCNPFTLGHRYLIEYAASHVDNLFIIPLLDSSAGFNYQERREMIQRGTADLQNVTVCEGSAYSISKATFPTYFLKLLDVATQQQIEIDLQIFTRYIAPALGAAIRFVGAEPFDPLTRRYNDMMAEILPKNGIELCCIDRRNIYGQAVQTSDEQSVNQSVGGDIVSASKVRQLIAANRMHAAMSWVPPSTRPFIMAKFAVDSLRRELDTTPKPGLVDKDNNGAHDDMDYILMERSINALRPYFIRLAQLGDESEELAVGDIKRIGLEAEEAMRETTNGVNTHKGALFSLGITVAAAQWIYSHCGGRVKADGLSELIATIGNQFEQDAESHGGKVIAKEKNILGARENAATGYKDLFATWVLYYRRLRDDRYREQKTLLKIMSMLDDTNIYHRAGADVAGQVKQSCALLLEHFSLQSLKDMDDEFMKHHISPGGAADMLALTILINAILE